MSRRSLPARSVAVAKAMLAHTDASLTARHAAPGSAPGSLTIFAVYRGEQVVRRFFDEAAAVEFAEHYNNLGEHFTVVPQSAVLASVLASEPQSQREGGAL